MKKFLYSVLLGCAPFVCAAQLDEIHWKSPEVKPPMFKFDVCFISETHRDWNFRSGEVRKALDEGKRVCSISIPQSPKSTVEERYVRNRVVDYISRVNPEVIYLPRVHEEYVSRYAKGNFKDRFRYVDPPDKDMAKHLVKVLQDFHLDSAKVWILYDHTTADDKQIWKQNLSPFKPTIVLVRTKNALRKYLRKITKTREAGVVINLMNSVEDTEYARYMTYEEIKHELHTQNRLHLTVGVEETRVYNEAIVFDYDEVDSEVRAFVNKEEFERIRLKALYLNSNWQYLGGFLGGRTN